MARFVQCGSCVAWIDNACHLHPGTIPKADQDGCCDGVLRGTAEAGSPEDTTTLIRQACRAIITMANSVKRKLG